MPDTVRTIKSVGGRKISIETTSEALDPNEEIDDSWDPEFMYHDRSDGDD